MGSGSSRAAGVVGMVVLVAVFGAVLYGGGVFVLAVLDGRSPRTIAWVGFGALLFMVGGQACRGDGVTEAAAPPGGAPPRVAVMDDSGHQIDWTDRDAGWRAVSQAAYVACVDEQELSIEVCSYRPVPAGVPRSIERLEQYVTVRVVEARTATEVGTFDLRDAPRACREVETEGQGDLHGKVSFSAFSAELRKFLAQLPQK